MKRAGPSRIASDARAVDFLPTLAQLTRCDLQQGMLHLCSTWDAYAVLAHRVAGAFAHHSMRRVVRSGGTSRPSHHLAGVLPVARCIFCKTSAGPFDTVEHIIPESLGNIDDILPPGAVCDRCNQYFGTKVESPALGRTILGVLRAAHGVPTKKGRMFTFTCPSLTIEGDRDGYGSVRFDRSLVWFAPAAPPGGFRAVVAPDPDEDLLLARLMLKMGLEYLATSGFVDPLWPRFDAARTFARMPEPGSSYRIALGYLPLEEISSISKDDFGPLEELKQYSYRLLGEPAFGYVFHFCYYLLHLCVPLTSELDFLEYIGDFNDLNPGLPPCEIRTARA